MDTIHDPELLKKHLEKFRKSTGISQDECSDEKIIKLFDDTAAMSCVRVDVAVQNLINAFKDQTSFFIKYVDDVASVIKNIAKYNNKDWPKKSE